MRKAPLSPWSKYFLIFSIAWFVVVVLSYFYVEDVQDGLHSLLRSIVESL